MDNLSVLAQGTEVPTPSPAWLPTIQGGWAAVCNTLYMATLPVIRQKIIHQHFYQGLRQRDKTGKVTLVAVMCKLLLHLNAMARQGTPWLPQEEWPSEPSTS